MNQRFQSEEIRRVSSEYADNELYKAIFTIGSQLESEMMKFGLCPEECFVEALEILSVIAEKGEEVIPEIESLWLLKHNEYRRFDRNVSEDETRKAVGIVFGFVVLAIDSSLHPFYRYQLSKRLMELIAEHKFYGWTDTLDRIFSVPLPDGWFDVFMEQSLYDYEDADTTAKPQQKCVSARKNGKSQQPKMTSGTYRYRWNDKEGSRIATLFQYLLRKEIIAKDTPPDDFMALFSGEESTARVKWLAPQAWLWYMLSQMKSKEYITMDGTIWMIASSHFVDNDGRLFNNKSFSKQKLPKKAIPALNRLVELLNVKSSIPAPDVMDDDPDAELWSGIKDKGWEMNEVD